MKWISSRIVYLLVSCLHKNEIILEHSSFSISSSLKNEVGFLKHSLRFWFQACIKMKPCSEQSSHSMSSSLKNEIAADHHVRFWPSCQFFSEQSSHSMSCSLKNEIALDHHVSFPWAKFPFYVKLVKKWNSTWPSCQFFLRKVPILCQAR